MVVGKVMRWSPWAPPPSGVRNWRFRVRIRVTRVEGLPVAAGRVAAVGVRWKGPPRAGAGRLSYLRRSKAAVESLSREAAVGDDGVAEWPLREEAAFENVCCFCSDYSDSYRPWEVSFFVLHGFCDKEKERKHGKLAKIGTTTVNLTDLVRASQPQEQGEGKESQLSFKSKQIFIPLSNGCSSIVYVNIMFEEVKTTSNPKEIQIQIDEDAMAKNVSKQDGRASVSLDTYSSDISQLVQSSVESDNSITNYDGINRVASTTSSSSSSRGSSPELQNRTFSKHRLLPWRKRTSVVDQSSSGDKDNGSGESSSNDNNEVDPTDTWENKEYISRDRQMKLKTKTFFASIDQRDESAGGESACTALVAVIAGALHSNGNNILTRLEFDALIKEGSSEWRKLCDNESYISSFPNKHFDLDTVLEAKIRPISVLSQKSFIGFFQPESFESLRGAMDFENIWDEISNESKKGGTKVYIVSWNDHFFLLKVEVDAYYIVDTLGERLFEGCNRAYMLRFDDSTEIYRLAHNSDNQTDEKLVCRGKECCREFIKEFLAAIPLREELEIERKGISNAGLHQRLQIEFHHTEAYS